MPPCAGVLGAVDCTTQARLGLGPDRVDMSPQSRAGHRMTTYPTFPDPYGKRAGSIRRGDFASNSSFNECQTLRSVTQFCTLPAINESRSDRNQREPEALAPGGSTTYVKRTDTQSAKICCWLVRRQRFDRCQRRGLRCADDRVADHASGRHSSGHRRRPADRSAVRGRSHATRSRTASPTITATLRTETATTAAAGRHQRQDRQKNETDSHHGNTLLAGVGRTAGRKRQFAERTGRIDSRGRNAGSIPEETHRVDLEFGKGSVKTSRR